jgi:catechol 2,3-dioxygenase-like lactoylglutathione lyase family enzyme
MTLPKSTPSVASGTRSVSHQPGVSGQAVDRRHIVRVVIFLRNVTFMTTDPSRLADFWSAALGLTERRDLDAESILADGDWSHRRLTFQKIPEPSSRPGKLHLDLTADDRRAEVRRLRNLGASELREVTVEDDWTWTVMADPDGNEFCVTDP